MTHEIKITPSLNGFLVKVGCQTLTYHAITPMIEDLAEYLNEPEKTTARFQEKAMHKEQLCIPPAQAPEPCATGSGILGVARSLIDSEPVMSRNIRSDIGCSAQAEGRIAGA